MNVLRAALLLLIVSTAGAQAKEPLKDLAEVQTAKCPRKDALGTTRTMVVDPQAFPRVGLKSFTETLPLADKEVVLTFDDGPFPPTTLRILAALANECVQATFFVIGRNAEAYPAVVKAEVAAGHSIGNHTWSHPALDHIPYDQALWEIDRGFNADEMVLNGKITGTLTSPFFRFPGFAMTTPLLDYLQGKKVAVFGADLWASDWEPQTPEHQYQLVTKRLEQAGRGIVLFHDTRVQTVRMLPAFLQYLRRNGYKVVHVVPPSPAPAKGSANDQKAAPSLPN